MMPAKLAEAEQMTIEEFLAFTDARPDGERWELIEGVAILNPSPTQWHQTIVGNILGELRDVKRAKRVRWIPVLGVGTRVPISPNSLPRPDVYVQEGAVADSPVTDDALILFEVLSRSNKRADRAWRKRVYSSIPNCQHYVTVSARKVEVVCHSRADHWEAEAFRDLDRSLTLAAIGVTIPLRDIYRWTPIE